MSEPSPEPDGFNEPATPPDGPDLGGMYYVNPSDPDPNACSS